MNFSSKPQTQVCVGIALAMVIVYQISDVSSIIRINNLVTT